MASANITFRTDEHIKRQAGEVFGEMGMDMTTGINVYLRMVAREKKIPFAISLVQEDEYKAKIERTIEERLKRSADPSTRYFSSSEVKEMLEL